MILKYIVIIFFFLISGLFFHVVGEGVVNLSRKAENFTDKENYIDFRLRLLGEPGKIVIFIIYKDFFFKNLSRSFHKPLLFLKSAYLTSESIFTLNEICSMACIFLFSRLYYMNVPCACGITSKEFNHEKHIVLLNL